MVGFLLVGPSAGDGITTVASGVEVFDRVLVMRFSEFSGEGWQAGLRLVRA